MERFQIKNNLKFLNTKKIKIFDSATKIIDTFKSLNESKKQKNHVKSGKNPWDNLNTQKDGI